MGIGDSKICGYKKVFVSLHGVSFKRNENIAHHIGQKESTKSQKYGRRKHKSWPNQVADETVKLVHDHIVNFPARESHYNRKDYLKRKY